MKYLVIRDVTVDECNWLDKTIEKDEILYEFFGATYGCIGPGGTAVTLSEKGDNPFFEMPFDSLQILPIR